MGGGRMLSGEPDVVRAIQTPRRLVTGDKEGNGSMTQYDLRVRLRSRRAAVLQLAAEEVRRSEGDDRQDGNRLARALEALAARLLVDPKARAAS